MKEMKRKYLVGLLIVLLGLALVGCSNDSVANDTEALAAMSLVERAELLIPTPNVRVVIGSTSTGGDTYQVSNMVARKLGEVLGKNVKVDAVGASNGFDAINRIDDGSTIMIFHDMAYLGYLYEREGYTDIFSSYQVGPTLAINPGNSFSAPKNSAFNTIEDVIEAVGNGEVVKVAIQPGGVSEIGYSAAKNAIKMQYPGMEENLVAVHTGSQSDKNQLLFDGQVDVIHSSIQANEQFAQLPMDDQKAMKFIWLTARQETILQTNDSGFGSMNIGDMLAYVSPQVSVPMNEEEDFTFDKEFFMLFHKDMDKDLVKLYNDAAAEVFADEALVQELKDAFFIPNYKDISDAQIYLAEKVAAYDAIISSLKE